MDRKTIICINNAMRHAKQGFLKEAKQNSSLSQPLAEKMSFIEIFKALQLPRQELANNAEILAHLLPEVRVQFLKLLGFRLVQRQILYSLTAINEERWNLINDVAVDGQWLQTLNLSLEQVFWSKPLPSPFSNLCYSLRLHVVSNMVIGEVELECAEDVPSQDVLFVANGGYLYTIKFVKKIFLKDGAKPKYRI